MNKEQIEVLKAGANQRCIDASNAVNQANKGVEEATIEWYRCQGEYRALDALLLNWPIEESDIIPEEDKTLDKLNKKGVKNG